MSAAPQDEIQEALDTVGGKGWDIPWLRSTVVLLLADNADLRARLEHESALVEKYQIETAAQRRDREQAETERDKLHHAYQPLAADLAPGRGPEAVHAALHDLRDLARRGAATVEAAHALGRATAAMCAWLAECRKAGLVE